MSAQSTEASRWTLSCVLLSESAQFCFVSVKNGGMMLSLNWQDGVVPVEDADCVVAMLAAELSYWEVRIYDHSREMKDPDV